MKKELTTVATIVALAVAGCGVDEDQSGGPAEGSGSDRAFVAAMIPHHESAVEMAEIAQKRGESKFVKDLADDIIRTQKEEITLMRVQDSELADVGVKPGKLSVQAHMMGMDDDPAMLEDAEPFDAAFIKMMIPHHEGAVEMAREELDKGEDPELKELAQNIIDAQQREIDEMIERSKGEGSEHGSGHNG